MRFLSIASGGRTGSPPPLLRGLVRRLLLGAGHQEAEEIVLGGVDLVEVDGAGGVDALGTDDRAFAHQRAAPDAAFGVDDLHALGLALIPGIGVVALQKRQRSRAGELGIEPVLRTGGIAQHAVDALRELVVLVHLRRRLQIGTVRRRPGLFGDDVGLDALELGQEVALVHGQVAHDGEVRQGRDAQGAGVVVTQEGLAAEHRHVVGHHAAAAADRHAARPPVGEATIQMVLDVLQAIEHRHVVREGDFIRLVVRSAVGVGVVAHALDGDGARLCALSMRGCSGLARRGLGRAAGRCRGCGAGRGGPVVSASLGLVVPHPTQDGFLQGFHCCHGGCRHGQDISAFLPAPP